MAKHAPAAGPGTIEKLAGWVLAPRAEEIPQAAVAQAKLLVLDTIGCGYAALDEESAAPCWPRSRTSAARRIAA